MQSNTFVHLKIITADDFNEFSLSDVDELVSHDDLLEVFENILLSFVHQIVAGVNLSKAVDAKTVGLIHVPENQYQYNQEESEDLTCQGTDSMHL